MEWAKGEISGILIDHGFMPLLPTDDEKTTMLKILIGMKYMSEALTSYELGDDK